MQPTSQSPVRFKIINQSTLERKRESPTTRRLEAPAIVPCPQLDLYSSDEDHPPVQ